MFISVLPNMYHIKERKNLKDQELIGSNVSQLQQKTPRNAYISKALWWIFLLMRYHEDHELILGNPKFQSTSY